MLTASDPIIEARALQAPETLGKWVNMIFFFFYGNAPVV